jgi:hypothetical protein
MTIIHEQYLDGQPCAHHLGCCGLTRIEDWQNTSGDVLIRCLRIVPGARLQRFVFDILVLPVRHACGDVLSETAREPDIRDRRSQMIAARCEDDSNEMNRQ